MYHVYANRMQAQKIIHLHDFLVKVVSRYIKIHYEKYQNVNFLALTSFAFH